MASNAQKQSIQHNIHIFADNKVQDWLKLQQQGLPCHVVSVQNQLVTVAFDINFAPFTLPQVQMPKAQSPYGFEPTQVGDKGYAVPGDFYLGGNSGIGGGTASRYTQANLSNLVFHPMSNKGQAGTNATVQVDQGPDGAAIQSVDGTYSVFITKAGGLVVTVNSVVLCSIHGGNVYLGGDGVAGSYAKVTTSSGPALAVWARFA